MAEPIAHGVATGQWVENKVRGMKTKAELLTLWDAATAAINAVWSTIPAHRFAEVDKAFGQWEMQGIAMILYAVDNEIHHRGQAYVYLRVLGIEPPQRFSTGAEVRRKKETRYLQQCAFIGERRIQNAMTSTISAKAAGSISIGRDLTVNRLGYGAMRITGDGIWGEPKDVNKPRRC